MKVVDHDNADLELRIEELDAEIVHPEGSLLSVAAGAFTVTSSCALSTIFQKVHLQSLPIWLHLSVERLSLLSLSIDYHRRRPASRLISQNGKK